MTNNDKIVLIGDSILNNNIYVPIGKSVADNIKQLHGNNIIIAAKDGATIDTCYYQLNNIINSKNYYLFISIGGNDILNSSYEKIKINENDGNNGNDGNDENNKNKNNENENKNKNNEFEKIKKKYIKMVDFIREKYPETKIYLLNLYFPTDEKYGKYKNIINEWNEMISSLSDKYKILKLDKLLTNSLDFTHGIEPSIIGSEKIARLIVES